MISLHSADNLKYTVIATVLYVQYVHVIQSSSTVWENAAGLLINCVRNMGVTTHVGSL